MGKLKGEGNMELFKDIDEITIEKIKKIIEIKNGEKVNANKTFQTWWITGADAESELEFRVSRLGNSTLIISRVNFPVRRVGTMTNIFLILKQFCEKEKISHITIQSVETKEMMDWCIKNGFAAAEFNIQIEDVFSGDYIYTV